MAPSRNTLAQYQASRNQSVAPGYVYPMNGNVPADIYHSTIDKVECTKTKAGNPSIDVYRTLKNSAGSMFHTKQRIPFDTPHMDDFNNAMLNVGVPSNTKFEDISGIQETVEVDYPNNGTGFGRITSLGSSTPPSQKQATMADLLAEDEADDLEEDIEAYLEDEDE